jgi:hypothetical protein
LFEKKIPLLLALHKNDDYDNKKQVTPWDKINNENKTNLHDTNLYNAFFNNKIII